jgi:putative glutamine amidotransferase
MDYSFDEYNRAIWESGGAPILLPMAHDEASLGAVLDHLDGLVLTGGPDVHPRFYGEEPQNGLGPVDEVLDTMELMLTTMALDLNLPVFAICRGLQVLNVALGGTLIQDISGQDDRALNHVQQAPKNVNTHTIHVEPDSIVSTLLKGSSPRVNSHHHQALKTVARGLAVTARARDGIVESVELPEKRFVLGVQWHPEGTFSTDENSRALFKTFVDKASNKTPSRPG